MPGKWKTFFVLKKNVSGTSDLTPEVCQRRHIVLKRQWQSQRKNEKLVAVSTNKLCSMRTVCIYTQQLLQLQKLDRVSEPSPHLPPKTYVFSWWLVPTSNPDLTSVTQLCFFFSEDSTTKILKSKGCWLKLGYFKKTCKKIDDRTIQCKLYKVVFKV